VAKSAEERDLIEGALEELQQELRFLHSLKVSDEWKYVLGLIEKERHGVKRLVREAPTDFLYLRASLADNVLESLPEILTRRVKEVEAQVTQKKFAFEQYK
jgi:anion-transporting  ArsA/GET3 family ATPase